MRLIVVWGPPTETAYKKTVGLAAVLLCASNRGRSQTAVLKLIISRPPLFYTHGGKGGTPQILEELSALTNFRLKAEETVGELYGNHQAFDLEKL